MEQLVARRAHNPKVAGSSPASATKKSQSSIWVIEIFLVMRKDFELVILGYEFDERCSVGDVATAASGG